MKNLIYYSLLQLLFAINASILTPGYGSNEDECTIKIFDVGQGNAVGIRYKYTENKDTKYETMLIDAGSKTLDSSVEKHNSYFNSKINKDEYKNKVIEDIRNFMLDENAIVKAIVVTHAHDDHYNLLSKIFKKPVDQKKIENIFLSGSKDLYLKNTNLSTWLTSEEFEDKIRYSRRTDEKSKKVYLVNENGFKKSVSFTEGKNSPQINLLSMNQGRTSEDRNDDSIVLQILCHKTVSILLTGDATATTWQGVKNFRKGNFPYISHILLIPHHGSKANMTAIDKHGRKINIVDIIEPEIAIFSTGLYYKYKHPHEDVYKYLEEKMAYRDDIPIVASFLDKNKNRVEKYTNNSIFSTVDHGTIAINIKSNPSFSATDALSKIPFTMEIERSQEPVTQLLSQDNVLKEFVFDQSYKVPLKLKKSKELTSIPLGNDTLTASTPGQFYWVQEEKEFTIGGYAYAPQGDIKEAYYLFNCKIVEDDSDANEDEESNG